MINYEGSQLGSSFMFYSYVHLFHLLLHKALVKRRVKYVSVSWTSGYRHENTSIISHISLHTIDFDCVYILETKSSVVL
jgi:hypothetical protein